MTLTKKENNGEIVLELEGRLDTTTAPGFQERLIDEISEKADLLLDFTKLDYVSSAGLRVLLVGQKTAHNKSCAMKLRGVSPDIMEVFKMTGFSEILTIV